MTMYDTRTNLSREVVEEVRKHFVDKVFDTIINALDERLKEKGLPTEAPAGEDEDYVEEVELEAESEDDDEEE